MNWLNATTTMPHWGLVSLMAAAGLAVAFLGYQAWQCRRWHVDIDEEGYDGDNYAEWDESEPEPVPATAELGRDSEKAAS